ncbi:LppX_LprAFG lipoprotein [Nocardioides limicola]|uniref:LppX_LprAFG lipoprotein n=1 Tax=Nocardioides limicola TaxID=2803368 RepID=UPI00193BD20D|nr:LppX_LprAFG lipoprotein [Nocardioides sp. DJM-14]
MVNPWTFLSGVLLVLLLSSCTDDPAPAISPASVLAQAKERIDATSGVQLRITSDGLPRGVQGLAAAEGVLTRAPAFEGTVDVVFAGTQVQVPVVAVDDTVYVQLPLVTGWSDIDPSAYGIPDPSTFLDPEQGLATLLTDATDVTETGSVRGGEQNREVLTEYAAVLPEEAVRRFLPTATGDVDASFTISGGELRDATLTGVFYPDAAPMSYVITFVDYDVAQEITAP